jgi:enamine deaminase RidA (YjgF/YER057c/UK114 family)
MNIERYAGGAVGRTRASAWRDLVFAVATAEEAGDSMAVQTAATLAKLDQNLADAGSSKAAILSATVYVEDISRKTEMDAIWCEWIGGAENWPQRACVQAGLAAGTLVEITLIAAREAHHESV